jgi:RNA ligase (TIGR02306 family)
MSLTPVEIVRVTDVEAHPHADRLEIVKVLNTQFVASKGSVTPGDLMIYFPPDMLIPEPVAEKLGVANYLKHSVFPGDMQKSRCRIGAIRLRGIASFGFGLPIDDIVESYIGAGRKLQPGDDFTQAFYAEKYQPPEQFAGGGGDSMRQPEAFHTYTDIQHYYRYAEALPEGTPVRITEKIHGTNSRTGLVRDNGMEFMCGTHHRRVKEEDAKGRMSLYWKPLTDDMKDMLDFISLGGKHNVIVFGEIYGSKVQQMDYGCGPGNKSHRVFDISVDGEYLDWCDVKAYCDMFDIETAPLLYEGPFTPELVEEYISGPTTLAEADQIACKFKGREGIVITPLEEEYAPLLNGRLILKAVSPDYYQAMK